MQAPGLSIKLSPPARSRLSFISGWFIVAHCLAVDSNQGEGANCQPASVTLEWLKCCGEAARASWGVEVGISAGAY